MSTAAVSLAGVCKSLAGVPVLCGVDLQLAPGSLTAVLGPSGCGKTTLLRLVAGFLAPDAGTITLQGREVAGRGRSVPTRERRLGYVPQEGGLFPHLTVGENVLFGLPRAERTRGDRLADLLDLVELPTSIADRQPHELSGGQQQRAAVARALARKPSVVLLDEPFSALDAGLRESTGRAVQRALRAAGATSLLVTHDQDQALSLADQVAVLRDGVLVQVGAPAHLYGAPVDPAVATFVGGGVLLPGHVGGQLVSCCLGELELPDGRACTGPEVRVLIRPEQLVLSEGAGTPASVVEIRYHGAEATILLCLTGSGQELLARVPGTALPAVGSNVSVCVRGPVSVYETGPVSSGATAPST